MNHVKHPLSPAGIDIFSSEICNFCYIKKYKYRLHFKTYFLIRSISLESLSVVLINLATILMMLGKLAALDLLIIKVFWNKGYDVIICVNDFTNKIFITWLKLCSRCGHVTKIGSSIISMGKVIMTSVFKDLIREVNFLRGVLGSSSVIWTTARYGLEYQHQILRFKDNFLVAPNKFFLSLLTPIRYNFSEKINATISIKYRS